MGFQSIEQVTSFLPSILPLFLFSFFLYKWLSPTTNTMKKSPPSPPKLPLIGNLHQVGPLFHRALHTMSQKYGGLIYLQLGMKPTVVVCSAKWASKMMTTHDLAISSRPQSPMFHSLFYKGKDVVFSTYNERWRHLRSVCVLQLLTNKRVRSFRQVREEEVALMVSNIKESPVVNLSDMLGMLTSDVICRVAFGRKYNGEKESDNIHKLVKAFAELFGTQNIEDVFPWMGWINSLNGINAKVERFHRVFDDFLERIIQDHANRIVTESTGAPEVMKNFVDILLEVQKAEIGAKDKPVVLDRDSIKGVIQDMFLAGTHTGHSTLEWVFTELMGNPRVMDKLRQEVRETVGDREFVSEDDLEGMVYLEAVIKEAFRLHPPLPVLVPRECREDVNLDEYHIAAGTQILINAWAIGRDPASWEDPESFKPERFLNSTVDFKGHDFELIPFGAGRRGCPGITFAMSTIHLLIANLAHQFEWAVPVGMEKDSLDMSECPGLSSHKIKPLVLVPTPRIK